MEIYRCSPLGHTSYCPPLEGAQGEEINEALFCQKKTPPP